MNSHYEQSKSFQTAQSDTITPDQIYQTLIRQTPNLYPLCKFKTKGTTKQLFPDAVKYPDFFNYNLVSPGRVIKKLQGSESLIKGFYYQLMKLAFEIEIQDKDYIEVMRSVIFSPEFMLEENPSSPSSGKNYSDLQYKKIVAEFMEILMHQSIPNFELTILSYPIVDEAMVKILQNLLKFKNSFQIPFNPSTPSSQILTHLSELFQVTVHQYGNCFKFEQSDIFFYEHSRNEYYIAFLNEMAQMSDISESSRRKDSSYGPVSSRKVARLDEQQYDDDYSGKKVRRTHQYLSSQFQIQSQEAIEQPQRQSSSNLLESKAKSEAKNDKNYRNTVGYNEISHNLEKTDKNVLNIQHRQSRQSLINQLHQLVHQTHQSTFYEDPKPTNEYEFTKKVEIPYVPMVRSIAQPSNSSTKNDFSHQMLQQVESQKIIKNPVKYEYQPKGYMKKTGLEDSSKFMGTSAQSDQVIGYSDSSNLGSKNGINLNPVPKNYIPQSFQSKLNIELKSKQITVKQQQTIEPLGINGGKSNLFTFGDLGAQLSSFGIGQRKIQSSPNQSLTRFSQQMPFLSSTKDNFLTNISTERTQKTDQIFYSPKPIMSKPTFIQQSKLYKSPLKNDQSLGTLYKQFTDTKVLNILPEQMQNKIRRMRRKYKGIHAKDFFGIDRF